MRDPFVRPDTVRLELGDGDWLVVKCRLSIGEIREAQALGLQYDDRLERWILNPRHTGTIDVAAYLVDWSFPVPIRQAPPAEILAAVESLELETFHDLRRRILEHEAAQEAQRAAQKKTPPGETDSSPISLSPDAAAGRSPRSAPSIPTNTTSSARH